MNVCDNFFFSKCNCWVNEILRSLMANSKTSRKSNFTAVKKNIHIRKQKRQSDSIWILTAIDILCNFLVFFWPKSLFRTVFKHYLPWRKLVEHRGERSWLELTILEKVTTCYWLFWGTYFQPAMKKSNHHINALSDYYFENCKWSLIRKNYFLIRHLSFLLTY